MNRINKTIIALCSFIILTTAGCAQVEEGQDSFVVRAEQTYQGTFQLFKSFTTFEHTHREYLHTVSPDIEKAANTIRTDGFDALASLQKAVIAYKSNRTPENKANIQTWLSTLEALEAIALEYMSKNPVK